MRSCIRNLLLAFIAIFMYCYGGNVFSQVTDTIIIDAGFQKEEIGSYCFYRNGDQFESFFANPEKWELSREKDIAVNPDKVHWIFCVVKNTDSADKSVKLYLNHVQSGIITLFTVIEGKIDSSAVTGSILPLSRRATTDRSLSVPLRIAAGKSAEIYLRSWRREVGMTFVPTLTDPVSDKNIPWCDVLIITVLAFIFFMWVASVFILKNFPSAATCWYSLYLLFGLFYMLAASGYGSLYLWSALPWFEENAAVFFAALSVCCFFKFSMIVLQTKMFYPRLNYLLKLFIIAYPVVGTLGFGVYFNAYPAGIYTQTLNACYLAMLICFITVLCISIIEAAFKQKKEFWWFALIFSFFILLAVITIMFETGLLDYNYKVHTVLFVVGALPQMTFTLVFLLGRILKLLKQRANKLAEMKLESKQVILNERLRIGRELHDDIGSTLSGIAMYSHLTKEQLKLDDKKGIENSLDVMEQSSVQMVNKLNDIVWLINPQQDSLQKLTDKLDEYTRQMALAKNMEVKIGVSEKIAELSLPVEQRRNIYLFCKEAINNAVKYSNGTALELMIKEMNGMLEFSVSDNGKGFDTLTVKRGNGLDNMQRRADEMGAKLFLESKKDEGVMLSLQMKIT